MGVGKISLMERWSEWSLLKLEEEFSNGKNISNINLTPNIKYWNILIIEILIFLPGLKIMLTETKEY